MIIDLYKFNNNIVRFRKDDGYICATDMCKIGKRSWSQYRNGKHAREFISELVHTLNIKETQLIRSFSGCISHGKGTWIHPRIATHLAIWISPTFAVKVTEWIEQWYSERDDRRAEYTEELSNLKPSQMDHRERLIRTRVMLDRGASIEIKTPVGYIDAMTDESIIEIKEIKSWKHALGQILSYSAFYPEKKRELVLFGEHDKDEELIRFICSKHGVCITFLKD